ncbi:hypothetical protein GQ53DRAFT_224989 [Thozetella sp. PMI_491]|nr:hypothetical protein GQ53DRAFT_224989 [Thozetella sp. PMI_491]
MLIDPSRRSRKIIRFARDGLGFRRRRTGGKEGGGGLSPLSSCRRFFFLPLHFLSTGFTGYLRDCALFGVGGYPDVHTVCHGCHGCLGLGSPLSPAERGSSCTTHQNDDDGERMPAPGPRSLRPRPVRKRRSGVASRHGKPMQLRSPNYLANNKAAGPGRTRRVLHCPPPPSFSTLSTSGLSLPL